MSNRISSPKRRRISASEIRDAIAHDLGQIKSEDRLTFSDMGRVMGKSADMAERYCRGDSGMDAETYTFCREAWGTRFTGTLDALIGDRDASCDRKKASSICTAMLAVNVMLEDDEITDEEVRACRKQLEEGRAAIDALLSRIGPRETIIVPVNGTVR